ncbi:hypothetical protein IU501_03200 [Nocardia otitidiscaviarum]|uniref:Uncharacterized protein n=1 Tax=Nocardia otitidiscaviarum TaxID=1823 RepID=A0A378Y6Q3_9NOCA|nr:MULTISPECIES: hypothetical protein [Nocardia]MBF6132007.1 hypothetical protein [Nocardia otitidiscaviarum]MBF6177918.1 hypothetical protein [Nocardia otitidiscaviarum]MBF6483137.1 hypothetical protein [Nocardia otitidiscaviarum]MCP9623445.1 hypothetical protein [Nocardia otitidiscaviarum]QDP78052.1 hypothetical protein FOH10_04180 [Nocardia otitidiscaviarum]
MTTNAMSTTLSMQAIAPSVVSASRGILAQGIRLSSVRGSGIGVSEFRKVFETGRYAPSHIVMQDKPKGDWQPTADQPIADFAVFGATAEAGLRPVHLPAAARTRNAHPATVIRRRHRSRPR